MNSLLESVSPLFVSIVLSKIIITLSSLFRLSSPLLSIIIISFIALIYLICFTTISWISFHFSSLTISLLDQFSYRLHMCCCFLCFSWYLANIFAFQLSVIKRYWVRGERWKFSNQKLPIYSNDDVALKEWHEKNIIRPFQHSYLVTYVMNFMKYRFLLLSWLSN